MDSTLRAALDAHYAALGSEPPTATAAVHVTEHAFRAVMGTLPTGVSVLTTRHIGGIWGMTVGSLTSLSLQPPLVLVCLRRSSTTLKLLANHGRFALSVLAADQAHIADTFAQPRDHTAAAATFITTDDLPVVPKAVGWLTCQHEHTYTSGDHAIVIGAVRCAHHSPGEPLVRHVSRYRYLR